MGALKDDSIDIIETAEFGAWGWHFLRQDRVPIVVRCHNPAHVVWPVNQPSSESWGMPAFLRKQDRLERGQTYWANGIASPSHALACHLSLNWMIPLNRFNVIPNPIDAELFRPPQENGDRREILYVGRLEYNKGVYDLAEALVPVLGEHRDVRVHFVGMNRPAPSCLGSRGRTALDVIRSIIPEEFHARLSFTPHVPVSEIVRLQHGALLAVMPTRGFESFSYTAVEAMACGTPVIATRCGGPCEIITHEQDGLLVPPGRPASLTEAMQRLLADPLLRDRLGRCGRQTVEARFSMPAVLPRIVDWYSDVIRDFKRDHSVGADTR
jgi:glycosyltransferase involved in cell wall biosynthesis